ncbi:MAG: GIY-YIG nuclease family protein [bacterium]|nr:GIY-YIG nuclease family protein [bacterium]
MFYVYMIKNSIDKLYIGITKNPKDRVEYHNQKRGACFTKYKSDFTIVFLEEYSTLEQARKREIQLKKWSRKKKDILIEKYRKELPTKM